MTRYSTETFFVPEEVSRRRWTTPASIYNLYRFLLIRNNNEPVFVPIRSMQFLAILDRHEINFVDSQSYAVRGDSGGRIIVVSWLFSTSKRETLDAPVPSKIVFYDQPIDDIQQRLIGEFKQAMEQLDRRYRDQLPATDCVNITRI